MNKIKLALIAFLMVFIQMQAMAYLGKPCDPEKDFKYVYLIKNWKKIPFKNQEETLAQVKWVNKMAGKKVWKYNPKPNRPVWACLSYGSSSVADWWAIELGRKLGSYKSMVNGKIEHGYMPRKLEAMYIKRLNKDIKSFNGDWVHYFAFPKSDLIRSLPAPANPVGYAIILTDRANEVVKDPTIPGVTYKFKPNDYPMEGMWKSILDGKRRHNASLLIDAIRKYGPILSQLELTVGNFLPGAHTPFLIGYGILKCKPSKVVFIIHDSYGKHPKNYKQDCDGGSSYRYVPAKKIDEAIAFPHVARAYYTVLNDRIKLEFKNSGKLPIRVNKVLLKDNSGKLLNLPGVAGKSQIIIKKSSFPKNFNTNNFVVYIDADYYAGMNGKGYWVKARKK